MIWFTSANVIILLWTDFYFSAKLYRAYVSRIVLLTIVAALEFVYFFSLCLPALTRSIYFECNIGPLKYECTGHPGQFYLLLGMCFISYMLMFYLSIMPSGIADNIHLQSFSAVLSVITMGLFLACCALNLTWTVASTKYCEMSRTMNDLMKKLRMLEEMGLRAGNILVH